MPAARGATGTRSPRCGAGPERAYRGLVPGGLGSTPARGWRAGAPHRLPGVADVAVRAARPGDVPEIARVQVDTWRTAYRRLLPPAVLDGLTPDRAGAAWAAAVTAPPTPAHRVLVATEQERLVGFVAVGPSEEDDAVPGEAAVAALLVEPRWGRRGHGSRLLAAAVDHLRADGTTRLVAWVPEADRVSGRFYESAGWERDGTVRTLEADGGSVREARWHVSLAPAEPTSGAEEDEA